MPFAPFRTPKKIYLPPFFMNIGNGLGTQVAGVSLKHTDMARCLVLISDAPQLVRALFTIDAGKDYNLITDDSFALISLFPFNHLIRGVGLFRNAKGSILVRCYERDYVNTRR